VHPVRGHYRERGGKRFWVRHHSAANPGRRAHPAKPAKAASIAVAAAVTVTVGGIVITATISSPPAGSAPSHTTGRPPSAEVSAELRADFKRTEAVLLASGYKVNLSVRFDNNCAAHSYDQVEVFFRANPCKWLARAYLAVREGNQALTLVAISWVGMSNISLAKKYKHLVDASDTGNITELSYDSGPYRNVRYTGNFYISGINGAAVWDAEVQPVDPAATAVANKILADSRQ
jgi:hypothetical protein